MLQVPSDSTTCSTKLKPSHGNEASRGPEQHAVLPTGSGRDADGRDFYAYAMDVLDLVR